MSKYNKLKIECCEANKQLSQLGIVDLTFGNVSIVDRSLGAMAIKPSGVDYNDLTPDNMVVLDFSATPDSSHTLDLQSLVLEGDLRPSSDTPTHMCLYQHFGDINSVVHTHSRNATAFAQAGQSIPCMGTTHADYFHGDIPITRPITADEINRHYEWETGNIIVETFKDLDPKSINAVLFNGHGPFVWGANGKKAIEAAFALELIADMTKNSMLLHPDAPKLPQAQLDKHYNRKHGSDAYYGQP